jgi:hypothetical protein
MGTLCMQTLHAKIYPDKRSPCKEHGMTIKPRNDGEVNHQMGPKTLDHGSVKFPKRIKIFVFEANLRY